MRFREVGGRRVGLVDEREMTADFAHGRLVKHQLVRNENSNIHTDLSGQEQIHRGRYDVASNPVSSIYTSCVTLRARLLAKCSSKTGYMKHRLVPVWHPLALKASKKVAQD